jgi:chorismate synthase
MSSCWGNNIKFSIFGESHGKAIGCVIDGLPAGEEIDFAQLRKFMARRAPGQGPHTTARHEEDNVEILSGVMNYRTTGAPLTAIIRNEDMHSSDYESLRDIPRPGHADFAAQMRYHGFQDVRGGGHFSGRLTAPLCIAGEIARQILARRGITVGAHISCINCTQDTPYDPVHLTRDQLMMAANRAFPVLDGNAGAQMLAMIADTAALGDSIGGQIEVAAIGVPGGLGDPMFDGVENRLSSLFFGIPAVRAVEFGSGTAVARMRGSENNDQFMIENGNIRTVTNNHGGVLGGITTGMPLIAKLTIKPTPSIALTQHSVSLSKKCNTELNITGRHDPCIVPRAVPVAEAAMALGLLDLM